MKRRIVALVGAAVLAASSALYAAVQNDEGKSAGAENGQQVENPEMRGSRHLGPFGILRILRALDLTEDQRASVKAILEEERPNFARLIRELLGVRGELQQATAHGHFDEAQLRALAKQQCDVSTELLVVRARVWSRIFAKLTPEQKAKADLIFELLRPLGRARPDESEE